MSAHVFAAPSAASVCEMSGGLLQFFGDRQSCAAAALQLSAVCQGLVTLQGSAVHAWLLQCESYVQWTC